MQTIQYQINTLMTTNGQSPFVTLFMQVDEGSEYEKEQAEIIEEILKQRLMGIKNEKGVSVTPPFPKLIYVLDEHNCLKGGKYDYLTKLAVKCSAKRMYPDYISAKRCGKITTAKCSRAWAADPSYRRGRTRTAITSGKDVLIRALYPLIFPRSRFYPVGMK